MKFSMKKSVMIFGIYAFQSFAFASSKDVMPENNYCSPIIDSKKYLSNDFSLVYPRKAQFECTYRCKANGKMSTVIAVSNVTVNSMEDDALNVVCQGVLVKRVTWGYDFDKIEPFYAFETRLNEIKRWAFENINQDPKVNSKEIELLKTLKTNLYTMSASFISAGQNGGASTAYFLEAGQRLSKIADGLPNNTKLLDEAIRQIIVNKGPGKLDGTYLPLMNQMLMSAAAWKIPSHQF